MRIAVAADHAGVGLAEAIIHELTHLGHDVVDLGTHDADSRDDYPDHAADIGECIRGNTCDRAILVCGSGVGASVAANKIPGVRAGLCHDSYSAHQGVEHDNMNVLCLGSRVIGTELALDLLRIFLNATYTGESRHERRLAKVHALEEKVWT